MSLLAAAPETLEALETLLQQRFGHSGFRPGQREVCEAVVEGKDALLVMPTGAGKSLCYQLPGLARGGTTLVISPLIALMEDQVAKLDALGTRVARIHSGLPRESARQVCRDYLDGKLDFLFIAPERLRVPGFGAMLAKRRPALVAVDEAHCISHWGHDFRADYRTLNQHLPALRPAPVLALTATATPDVQNDICVQLGLLQPARFIHGFRRHNLAIEAIELKKAARPDVICKLLASPQARPAIVYTSSRRDAESLAITLSNTVKASCYHAGMGSEARSRVQREFLEGSLEVVVATVAFGMGVDKANVRTVVHAAMPATLESYYQEIGRAGRDGQPSRAVLLHSYADVKTQEFLLERDYPNPDVLAQIHRQLRPDATTVNELRGRCHQLDDETFGSALDRLIGHGGAALTSEYEVMLGPTRWLSSYEAHLKLRREQVGKVLAYAQAHGCRMALLVRHFGDNRDSNRDCGLCDWCDRRKSSAREDRALRAGERAMVGRAVEALRGRESLSTGKLQAATAGAPELSRGDWDSLLREASRVGLFFVEEDSFQKEGERISYRKVSLVERLDDDDIGKMLDQITVSQAFGAVEGKRKPLAGSASRARTGAESSFASARPRQSGAEFDSDTNDGAIQEAALARKRERVAATKARHEAQLEDWSTDKRELNDRLRCWRTELSKDMRVPAFFILSETVLQAIVIAAPRSLPELRRVPGVGPDKLNRFGADICRIVSERTIAVA